MRMNFAFMLHKSICLTMCFKPTKYSSTYVENDGEDVGIRSFEILLRWSLHSQLH